MAWWQTVAEWLKPKPKRRTSSLTPRKQAGVSLLRLPRVALTPVGGAYAYANGGWPCNTSRAANATLATRWYANGSWPCNTSRAANARY
jgi:hypothetical protein